MAQLPTIAGTAARRLFPTADMRVTGVEPAAFGSGVGAGLQKVGDAAADLGGAVQKFELAKQQEEDRLANFDRSTQLVNFGSDQAEKLDVARRELSGPAQGFMQGFMQGFDADATKFLDSIPERDKPQWSARLAQLRSGVASDALRSEFTQRDQWAKATIGDTLGKLQNGAMSSPDKLTEWQRQGEEIIAGSPLSAQDKLEYTNRWRGQVAVAAATGDVQRDPEGAIRRLGGVREETRTEARGGATAGSPTQAGVGNNPGNLVDGAFAKAQPGYTGSRTSRSGYEFATFATPEQGAAAQETLLKQRYLGRGLDTPREILMKYSPPTAKGNTQEAFNNYLSYIKQHAGIGPDDKVSEGNLAAFAKAQRGFETGTGSGSAVAAVQSKQTVRVDPAAPELDARYAELPVEAREQLIGQAQREISQRQAVAAASEQQAHATWLNGFLNDINDGKAGAKDIDAARKAGILTDFDEIHRAQSIVEDKTKGAEALGMFNAALGQNGFVWNPYDGDQKKAVEAGVKNMGGSPQAAFNVWQRTGILADAGAVALRGGLVSTNPQAVQVAANIASNMIRTNPNAFATVQGGKEMEDAAFKFSHYTYDLGLAPDVASKRIAEENTPGYKAKIKVPETEVAELMKDVRKNGISTSAVFKGGYFSSAPKFATPAAAEEANQSYAELVLSNMQNGNDRPTAEAMAGKQLQKTYAIGRNGTVAKYPPELGYPPVAGSHAYVYQDAVATVKGETGKSVPIADVHLIPIPGVTDGDFRRGAPPRYRLVYGHSVNGQWVLDAVPGEFAAQVPADAVQAGPTEVQARSSEQRARARVQEDMRRMRDPRVRGG